MSTVNISALGNLVASDNLDLDTYADVKDKTFRLPKKGRYLVRAPESFPDTAFGATKAGHLKAQIDPTIVGPTNEGFQIRFVNISAKPYERSGGKVSQFGDYLRACGRKGPLPGDPQALADAVAATAGQTYYVDLDWKAYNSTTGMEVRGMENFPVDENGEPMSFVEDPGDITENGPKRLRANLEVRRFISA
jgi:hypothetical protein